MTSLKTRDLQVKKVFHTRCGVTKYLLTLSMFFNFSEDGSTVKEF